MPSASSSPTQPVRALRVWDLPTRLFHWGLAGCVIALVVTAKTGAMDWHFRLGYAAMALLLFRILWGFVGGHWSRFTSFLYSPATLLRYLRGQATPAHELGHSPLGALSVLALLLILSLQVLSGMASDDAITFTGPLASVLPGSWSSAATDWHKGPGQWVVIGLLVLHLLAVLVYVFVRRKRLVRPMLSGDKHIHHALDLPPSRDNAATRVLALVLFGISSGMAAWVATFQG